MFWQIAKICVGLLSLQLVSIDAEQSIVEVSSVPKRSYYESHGSRLDKVLIGFSLRRHGADCLLFQYQHISE